MTVELVLDVQFLGFSVVRLTVAVAVNEESDLTGRRILKTYVYIIVQKYDTHNQALCLDMCIIFYTIIHTQVCSTPIPVADRVLEVLLLAHRRALSGHPSCMVLNLGWP